MTFAACEKITFKDVYTCNGRERNECALCMKNNESICSIVYVSVEKCVLSCSSTRHFYYVT